MGTANLFTSLSPKLLNYVVSDIFLGILRHLVCLMNHFWVAGLLELFVFYSQKDSLVCLVDQFLLTALTFEEMGGNTG